MDTLESSLEAKTVTGGQAGRMTKPLIGARATALPKNEYHNTLPKKIFPVISKL